MDNVKGFRPGFFDKLREARRNTRMGALYEAGKTFYATHPVSPWQHQRVKEIRSAMEFVVGKIRAKADTAIREIEEEYMQYELDYLYASDKFRQENPGKEYVPSGWEGVKHNISKWFRFGQKAPVTTPHGEEGK